MGPVPRTKHKHAHTWKGGVCIHSSSCGTKGGHVWSQAVSSLVAQGLRIHIPEQETRVQTLSWEDPLEKEMETHFSTHSSILAWRIPWTEEPGGLQSMGSQRVGHNLATKQQQQKQ